MSNKKVSLENVTVNLTLLKTLVTKLDESLAAAEQLKGADFDFNEYVVEMSKAIGLTTGVFQESSALIMDINAAIKLASVNTLPEPKEQGSNFLESLLGPLKTRGSSN